MFGDTASAQVIPGGQAYTAEQVAAMTEPPGAPNPTSPYTPDQQQILVNQLNTYKTQLAALYANKSDLISASEALRFQHLTAWRFQLESTLSAISSKIAQDGNSNLADIFRANFSTKLLQHVPMATINGDAASGYGSPIGWGMGSTNVFSPITDLLSWMATAPAGSVNLVLTSQAGLLTDNQIDRTTWYFNANIGGNGVQTWTNPPSLAFIKAVMGTDDNTVLYINGLINQDFGYGSLVSLIPAGVQQNKNLVNALYAVLKFQPQIDDLETQIKTFISQYQAAGMLDTSTNNSVLQQLQQISNNQNAQKVLEVAETPPVSNTVVADVTTVAPAPTPASNPNWLLYAGVFAVAVLIIKRKKKS